MPIEPTNGVSLEMRIFFVLLVTAMAATAAAGEPNQVDAKEYSCEELQQLVQERGRVNICAGIGSVPHYSSASYCRGQPNLSSVRVADGSMCAVGYVCVFRPDNK